MPFTREDDLRLSIRMGLTKGLRLIRGMRRQLDEDERSRVAEAIRLHLERAAGGSSPDQQSGGTPSCQAVATTTPAQAKSPRFAMVKFQAP